jgi:hypothetical protein
VQKQVLGMTVEERLHKNVNPISSAWVSPFGPWNVFLELLRLP